MKYVITIEETTSQEFQVEAENFSNAIKTAVEKYNNCEFILSPGNIICKQMCVRTIGGKEVTEWIEF